MKVPQMVPAQHSRMVCLGKRGDLHARLHAAVAVPDEGASSTLAGSTITNHNTDGGNEPCPTLNSDTIRPT